MTETNPSPTNHESGADGRELVLTRVFDAPRDLVFRAHTEAEHLKRWWGPKGFTLPACTVDLRPGGLFHYCMRSPDGRDMWGKWVFREIAPPERLVCVVSFADEQGNTVRAPFNPDWPLEILGTTTFTEHEGRTTLTMRAVPLAATETERRTFEAGWQGFRQGCASAWDQLAGYLANAVKGQAQ